MLLCQTWLQWLVAFDTKSHHFPPYIKSSRAAVALFVDHLHCHHAHSVRSCCVCSGYWLTLPGQRWIASFYLKFCLACKIRSSQCEINNNCAVLSSPLGFPCKWTPLSPLPPLPCDLAQAALVNLGHVYSQDFSECLGRQEPSKQPMSCATSRVLLKVEKSVYRVLFSLKTMPAKVVSCMSLIRDTACWHPLMVSLSHWWVNTLWNKSWLMSLLFWWACLNTD